MDGLALKLTNVMLFRNVIVHVSVMSGVCMRPLYDMRTVKLKRSLWRLVPDVADWKAAGCHRVARVGVDNRPVDRACAQHSRHSQRVVNLVWQW